MVKRSLYLDKLLKLKDTDIIKVITGVRRCGKSTLLEQFKNHLKIQNISDEQIIYLNFEKLENETLLDYHKLYHFLKTNLILDKINYIFLDEIQIVKDFQKAVNSIFILKNVDLYITGSNAYMLSGELATLLSGRYIEIKMLPLSFKEYCELEKELDINSNPLTKTVQKIIENDKKSLWNKFFVNGGFPYLSIIQDEDIRRDYIQGIYHTVLLKDIVQRKNIQDVSLLESIIKFLFDNIGNIVSPKKIADSLTSFGKKTTSITVENYINALQESFILYKVGRYDVKGKQYLKSLEKYYIVDQGLRNLLLAYKNKDIGSILENIVYLELFRRGYNIYIGKIDDLEIDFIVEKGNDRIYYQVSTSILEPSTFEREIRPLKKIKDNYPKFIITMDDLQIVENGIKQINIIDFLFE